MDMPGTQGKVAQRSGFSNLLSRSQIPDLGATGVVLLILFGLALRLAWLAFQPLWWDEGYSVWFATHPLTQMAALTAQDIHPPLYYALLHGWAAPLGTSPTALRLLSVVVGMLTIPLLFLVARRMLSARAALLAAFLLTINPLHIYYSQEVRMYGLVRAAERGDSGCGLARVRAEGQRSRGAEERKGFPISAPPHLNTSARLHHLVHRRALYPILRHLPAHRPDDLCGLALAARPAGAPDLARRTGDRGAAVPAVGALRRAEAGAVYQSEDRCGCRSAARGARLSGATSGCVPCWTSGRAAGALVAGRATAVGAGRSGVVAVGGWAEERRSGGAWDRRSEHASAPA